jgi:hypothetical protein
MTISQSHTVRFSLALAGTIALLASAAPAGAASVEVAMLQSAGADLAVYTYYCAPGFSADIGAHPAPDSMQLAIASSAFRFQYGADCRAYYLGEIEPLLTRLLPAAAVAANT